MLGIAENLFVDDLVEKITSNLRGITDSEKRLILPNYPRRLLILGSLSEEDPSFSDIESSSVKSNSITLMFLTKEEVNIKVKPNLNLYYGVKELKGELESHGLSNEDRLIPFVWKRLETEYPYYSLNKDNLCIDLDFKKYICEIENDDEHRDYYQDKIPDYQWSGQILLEIENYSADKKIKLIKIRLINKTPITDKKGPSYETSFFNCSLEIDLGYTKLIQFSDKRENDFGNIKEIKSNFKTLNCGYIFDENKNIVKTTTFKRVDQKKIFPKDYFNMNGEKKKILFSELTKSTKILHELHEDLFKYLDKYKKNSQYEKDMDFKIITDNYEKVVNRFKEGIDCLESNQNANKAFQLMQITFDKYTEKEDYHGWRIFQIVFIVSLITDIINKNHERRKEVDLLHVNTGGGKSEAYFGLVVFSAFYDRLSGKKFGTTAITKFPLRMLSVDQLQRISNIFIHAENIRKENIHKDGDDEFSVAYFVGQSEDFPRYTIEVIDTIKQNEKKGLKTPGRIINSCPLCKGDVFLKYDGTNKIIHYCENCKKEYLLFITDEEIYRYLPTFIVSTVDKLAGLSSQRRFRNIIGGKLSKCTKGHGYIPRGDFCEVYLGHKRCEDQGIDVNYEFDSTPSLIIQDEMHLIREGFGAIDSHFETFIESLHEEINEFKFKNITMTATVKGAEVQNKTIYWKEKTNIFPSYSPHGKGKEDPFYGFQDINQRVILGIKPNFRDNQYACLVTLRYLAEFVSNAENNIKQLSEKYKIKESELKEIISKYKCIMTYHNKKSDVNAMNFYMHAVVNDKLQKINYSIKHDILTGNDTLEVIKSHIQNIKNFDNSQNKISALSCTSIVSHGIDITKWNFMCFQGIPGSTAEYIQALSRIGRKDVGIVFLWFYPNRVRDISYYNLFNEYHEDIDLFVENVPVERWTKIGFKQTFHSLFCGAILNYISNRLEKPIYNIDHIESVFFTPDAEYNNKRKEELIEFLERSYHVKEGMPNSEFMIEMIAKGVNERLNYLHEYATNPSVNRKEFFPNALDNNDKKYWRRQFGMRGIQDTVNLRNYQSEFVRKYNS